MHLRRIIIALKRRQHQIEKAIAAMETAKREDTGRTLGRDRCRTVLGATCNSATPGMLADGRRPGTKIRTKECRVSAQTLREFIEGGDRPAAPMGSKTLG